MKSKKIIIGSRGSKLALIYAERARAKILKFCPEVEIKKITTTGDINQKDRLSEIGGKGLFSKQIENELLNEKIDIAVHALKDMPSDETEDLLTNCFLERNDPREVLISHNNDLIKDLKPNSIVGTSSFRREFQLKKIRSDLNYKLIRGNVDTRIKKLNEKLYDAIILSYAGIQSLKLDKNISQIFSTREIIPSVGQGVVTLQCRKNDSEIINNQLFETVHPCLVSKKSYIGNVNGVMNAVIVNGSPVGESILQGEGAGPGPTSSALMSDLLSILRGNIKYPFGVSNSKRKKIKIYL